MQQVVAQHGFSRYPLLSPEGEPTGYLHIKDVLDIPEDECDYPVSPRRIRKLVSVSQETDLEDALAMLRRTRSHLARVHKDSGETVGVLFLEDIIEELVGEVRDATRRVQVPGGR